MQDVFIQFYGVRGSYPVSSPKVARYGGNTSSILISGETFKLIFDAGTGIINIGKEIAKNEIKRKKVDIFLTHLHLDHIQGLPFFKPIFDPDFQINIFCPDYQDISVEDFIYSLFNDPISPISDHGIKANINIVKLPLTEVKTIAVDGNISVSCKKEDSHPLSGVLIYKLSVGDRHMVFATDVESPDGFNDEMVDFIKGSHILIHDSQYFDSYYHNPNDSRIGFGHSTCSMAVHNALACQVEKLYLFHYHPDYSDKELNEMLKKARGGFKQTYLARELMKFRLRS